MIETKQRIEQVTIGPMEPAELPTVVDVLARALRDNPSFIGMFGPTRPAVSGRRGSSAGCSCLPRPSPPWSHAWQAPSLALPPCPLPRRASTATIASRYPGSTSPAGK